MENMDFDIVDFEMDIYWVVIGGVDFVEYLEKYFGCFKFLYVKDWMKDVLVDECLVFCVFGNGMIDYLKILDIVEK